MKAKVSRTCVLTMVLSGFWMCLASELIQENQPPEPDHLFILTLLFPETSDWMRVEEMPRLKRDELDRIETSLKSAYRKSKFDQGLDECFLDGLFDPSHEYERNFHRFDLNADGIDDIIYCGSSICVGGDAATVIWLGEKNGFRIGQAYLWKIWVLRMRPGDPVGVASVEVGCCDDPYDVYSMGTLDNPKRWGKSPDDPKGLGQRTIVKSMVLPKILFGPVGFDVSVKEMALRSSPKIDDSWSQGRGEYWGNAVFGNILSKYMAGCSGTIIGRNQEEGPDLWYFVLVDGCEAFRIHSPYEVSAGWVQASEISLLK
jgi:hypothetical protein